MSPIQTTPCRAARPEPALLVLLLLAALPLLVSGCRSEPTDEQAPGLSPEGFMEVMVSLREAEREALATDSARAAFEQRREEILAEHGITGEELREFVRLHQADFELMDRLWDSIAQRLKHVPEPLESGADRPLDELR